MEEIVLTENEAGLRLDRYLRKLLRAVPLSAIHRHLRQGRIRVNGSPVPPELRLVPGMRLQLDLPKQDVAPSPPAVPAAPAARTAVAPPNQPQPRIVHQDEQLLVISKPAGLAVHAGSGQRWTVDDWLSTQRAGVRTGTFRPAAAHRLDRGTSGLLVIGLLPDALRALTAAFRAGKVDKTYWAIVHGVPAQRLGSVVAPLYVDPRADRRDPKVLVDERGQPARTDYEVLRTGRHLALLKVVPREGRQHQIRVHLASIGHPIVGDDRYGSVADVGQGFLLHAGELRLPHPRTGRSVTFSDPMPAHYHRLLMPD